jgi:hypothetical protein
MSAASATFKVKTHVVEIVRLEKTRWWVNVDGHRFASFCSESRARAAGRREARRLDFTSYERASST